jgi:hypothetical protein
VKESAGSYLSLGISHPVFDVLKVPLNYVLYVLLRLSDCCCPLQLSILLFIEVVEFFFLVFDDLLQISVQLILQLQFYSEMFPLLFNALEDILVLIFLMNVNFNKGKLRMQIVIRLVIIVARFTHFPKAFDQALTL